MQTRHGRRRRRSLLLCSCSDVVFSLSLTAAAVVTATASNKISIAYRIVSATVWNREWVCTGYCIVHTYYHKMLCTHRYSTFSNVSSWITPAVGGSEQPGVGVWSRDTSVDSLRHIDFSKYDKQLKRRNNTCAHTLTLLLHRPLLHFRPVHTVLFLPVRYRQHRERCYCQLIPWTETCQMPMV